MWHEFGEPLADAERPEWPSTWSPPPASATPRQVVVEPVPAAPHNKWTKAINASKAIAKVTKPLILGVANKRTRKPPAWRSFKEVSVAGIDATLDKRSPLLRRVLWGAVLIVCTALMVAQCLDRVVRYLDEPVNVNVRITHNESLEFPSVTVCNKNPFNRTEALQRLIKSEILSPDATEAEVNISLLVGVNGMTASDVWTALAHDRDIFVEECWFGRGVKCGKTGVWTAVHTVMGPCYTFKLHNVQVSTTGTFNNLYMVVHETTPTAPKKGELGARVLLHEHEDSPVLLARTHGMTAELNWTREVKLELRKFQTLNTAKTPCIDDPSYSEARCHSDCFQKAMYDVSKCRMPYMSADPAMGNVSECATPGEYEEAMAAIGNMLLMGAWTSHQCECQHECYETTYLAYPENMAFYANKSRMRIFFEELVFEQISEEMAYPMISLLCDIGGTLGLLMGASVLTVCELLEVLWSRILQGCCRLEERQPPALKPEMQLALSKLRPPLIRVNPAAPPGFSSVVTQAARHARPPQHHGVFA